MTFRFVSLGADCQPAYQINRQRDSQQPQLPQIPMFFDWLGSTTAGVSRLIEADFDGLLDDDNLVASFHANNLHSVVDARFRLEFAHDFTRFDRDNVERARLKFRLRARWFLELFEPDSPPTYFVRRAAERELDNGDAPALALLRLLQSRRRDCRLLYLHDDPSRPPGFAPGFRSAFLRQPRPFYWQGLDSAWAHALDRVALEAHDADGEAFALPPRRGPNFSAGLRSLALVQTGRGRPAIAREVVATPVGS